MKYILAVLMLVGMAGATVSNVPYTVTYTCTGTYGPFAFNFSISDPTALTVTMNGTLLVSANYTVIPINANYDNGGKVTLGSGYLCTAGWKLVLTRSTPITQNIKFYQGMPTPNIMFENGLDKLTEIAQETAAKNTFPSPVGQSGKYLGSNGTVYVLAVPPGGGNVVGPGLSVTNDIAGFTDTSGTIIKDVGIPYTNLPTMASNAAGSGNILTTAGANKTVQDSGVPLASYGLPSQTGKTYYGLSTSGSAASWTAPMTYPAALFGIVADNSTDNTAAINSAATALTAIGPGNRLLLPVGGTKVTTGTLQLKGMILVGTGAPGWNSSTPAAPSSYLHITYNSGTTPSIQCLEGVPCGLENLRVVNDGSNSPFMEYTCGIPWLDNVQFIGKVSRTSGGGTGVPTNDGILFGDVPGDGSSACSTTAAGFSGYGSNHIQNLYFQNVRTFISLFDNANGLNFYGLRGDFTDANTTGYMISINGQSLPAYGNTFQGNFEQAKFGGGAGSCNYKGVIGLDNYSQANHAIIEDSDVGDCTNSVWILNANATGNYIVAMSGFFSGGAFSNVSGSYPNFLVDMPNNTVANRYYTGVYSGTHALPFNEMHTVAIAAEGAGATITGTGACATHSTQSGGAWAGQVTCTGTTGASTLIVTPGSTATHGWSCWGSDQTNPLAGIQTANSATSCTLSFSGVTTSDVLTFGAVQF